MGEQLCVSFTKETLDSRTLAATYWFEVKFPGYEQTSFDFGLSKTGEWTNGSNNFFSLDIAIRNQALSYGRSLLKKIPK